MNDKATNEEECLKQIEMRLVERFEHISESFGIRGLKARLLSVLFTSAGEPRSLTELTILSHFSKAQVSRAMRELILEMPMIEVVKKPQDRERYYVIRIDIMDFITGFISKTIYEEADPTIKATGETITELNQLIKTVKDKRVKRKAERLLSRVIEVNRQYKKYLWISKKLLSYLGELNMQWQNEHLEN